MTSIPLNTPEVFNQQFKRGIIIFTEVQFEDGSSGNKLLIPVNLDCNDTTIYCLKCTSRITRYQSEPYCRDGLFVTDICEDAFPVPTVIICTDPIVYSRQVLSGRFCRCELRLIDSLPDEVIEAMDEKLGASRTIARSIKNLIVTD